MFALVDDPVDKANLRGNMADAYADNGLRAPAIERYSAALSELTGVPLSQRTTGLFFGQAGRLFTFGQEEASSFDGDALVQASLAFASQARVAALAASDDGDKDAAVLYLADRLHGLAGQFEDKGDENARVPLLQREVELREPLAVDPASRADRLDDLANAYRDLNQALSTLDRDKESVVYAQKRVDIRREQAGKRSFAFRELNSYVWALRDLGDEQRYTDDYDAAMESYKEGDRVAATLLKRFPRESGSYEVSAAIATAMGNATERTLFRLIYHKKAEAVNLAQIKQLGEKEFDYDFLAVSQLNIGGDYLDADKYAQALPYLAKALDASDKSLADNKDSYSLLKRRALILDKTAKCQRALVQTQPLIGTLRLRMETLEKMQAINGTPSKDLGKLYGELGQLLRDNGGDATEIAAIEAKAQQMAE
jgi:tetratricopeptide (TPR) repeat protein